MVPKDRVPKDTGKRKRAETPPSGDEGEQGGCSGTGGNGEGEGDGEGDGDLGQRDAEIAAEPGVLQQSGEHAEHVGQGRQQSRIGEAEAGRRFPQRCKGRDEDKRTQSDQSLRHGRACGYVSAAHRAGMRWCRCLRA